MIGLMRNTVPSASRYSLHTSLASNTSTSLGVWAASDAPSFTQFLARFRVRTRRRGAQRESSSRPGRLHNRSDLGVYSASEAAGRSRNANRHREPSFASGLDPSPDVAASCGSDAAAISARELPSPAFSG